MSNAAVVSRGLGHVASLIDRELEKVAGERLGFILLVWAGGEVNYVSSDTDRKAVAKAMREVIAKWEAGTNDTPAHQRH